MFAVSPYVTAMRHCFGSEFDLLSVYNTECDMISPFGRGSLYYASRDGKGDTTHHLAIISDHDYPAF
jgi:hypothetical protein